MKLYTNEDAEENAHTQHVVWLLLGNDQAKKLIKNTNKMNINNI